MLLVIKHRHIGKCRVWAWARAPSPKLRVRVYGSEPRTRDAGARMIAQSSEVFGDIIWQGTITRKLSDLVLSSSSLVHFLAVKPSKCSSLCIVALEIVICVALIQITSTAENETNQPFPGDPQSLN